MAPTTPTKEPAFINAGDTLKFVISEPDYPASDGWTLEYYLQNAANSESFSSVASVDSHLVTVLATTTVAWTPGSYRWTARAEKSGEKFVVRQGSIEVKADLASNADQRSHAEKTLAAINALIEGKALRGDQQGYSISGRSITRMGPGELKEWREYYQRLVNAEIAKEARAQGKTNRGVIRTRFSR